MGTKTDLEIMGSIAKEMKLNLGIWLPDKVFAEIRKTVRIRWPLCRFVDTGGPPDSTASMGAFRLFRVRFNPRATHFTSGSLTRYSKILNAVIESPLGCTGPVVNFYLLALIKTRSSWGFSCVSPTCNGSSAR